MNKMLELSYNLQSIQEGENLRGCVKYGPAYITTSKNK